MMKQSQNLDPLFQQENGFYQASIFIKRCADAISFMFLIASVVINPCLADPIPVPPPPIHVKFLQLAVPILVNYLWNFVILGAIFNSFGIKVKNRRFLLFILVLTLTGLTVDAATFVLNAIINFFGWIFIVGVLLFLLSFKLTELFYGLPRQKSIISGLAYAVLSHPIIGITFVTPLLARFSLVPTLF